MTKPDEDSKTLFDKAFDLAHNAITGKRDVTLEATFSVEDEAEDGDDVVLSGPLFHVGSYPEKHFSLSPTELHDTIAAFLAPKPMDLHHRSNIFGSRDLTGAFGEIDAVWTDDNEWLKAKVRKPKWLHQIMPEQRVSATFDTSTKELIGAAWTAKPVIDGARLVAAFAEATEAAPSEQNSRVTDALSRAVVEFAGKRHDTPSGQSAMQRIHDVTAQAGATCSRANFASRHETRAIQQAHDLAVTHGAVCESTTTGGATPSTFSEPGGTPTHRSKRMSLRDLWKSQAKEQGIEIDDAEIEAAFSGTASADVEAIKVAMAAKDAEIERLRANQEQHTAAFAQVAEERRQAEAVTFAQRQVTAHRVPPAAAEKLAAVVARIKGSDSTATFAEGQKPTLTLFEEFVEALPDLTLFTTPQLENASVAALFSQTETEGLNGKKEPNQDTVNKLLAATSDGRKILETRTNA